jgi:NAD-dependent deacetylase
MSEIPEITCISQAGEQSEAIPGWARGVRRVAVLTGAGVSTDSGIPDFRGPGGAWTLHPGSEAKYTYEFFLSDPAARRSYWESRRDHPVWQAEPNAGHRAIAGLMASGPGTAVMTQNTDGLHQRAGTPPERVIELHGTLHHVVCIECEHREAIAETLGRMAASGDVPGCPDCGGVLKTDTVMFGQVMAPEAFALAEQAVADCDLLLVVGTTLLVEPAASLCALAVRAGAKLVIVNRDPTPYDAVAVAVVREPIGTALPRIVSSLISGAGEPVPEPGASGSGEVLEPWRRSAERHGLALSTGTVAGVVAAAMLCGAADETTAVAVLQQVPGAKDLDRPTLTATARWLRDEAGDATGYWGFPLPDAAGERIIAAMVAVPGFLVGLHMETTPLQDRRSLAVLTRSAAKHPTIADALSGLLDVLPGLAPAAVETVLDTASPEPLVAALTALARRVPLPADLLEAVPSSTPLFGEFPVVLAESLVAAYEQRVERRPAGVLPVLARTLDDLAARLAILGRDDEAASARRRALAARERLACLDPMPGGESAEQQALES